MRYILILSLLNILFIFKSESQLLIPKCVDDVLYKSVFKNLQKENIKCKTCKIQLIYWLEYHNNDSLSEIHKLDEQIINSLSFCNDDGSSVDLKTPKGINNLLYTAVIFDTVMSEAKYFQAEKFRNIYHASIFERYLTYAVKKYSIKKVFYMVNVVNNDNPYLLEDENGSFYIFYVNFGKIGSSESKYEVVPLKEYHKSFRISKN